MEDGLKTAVQRHLWRPRVAVVPTLPINCSSKRAALFRVFTNELTGHLTSFPELHVFARPPPMSIEKSEWRPPDECRSCADYRIRTEVLDLEESAVLHVYLDDVRHQEVISFWKIAIHVRAFVSQMSEAATNIANEIGNQHGTIQRAELAHLRRLDVQNETAFGHYLQALELIDAGGAARQQQGLAHIEQAIALDGEFPRYWLYDMMISDMLASLESTLECRQRWLRRLNESMEVAFSLAPRDPMVLSQIARIYARGCELDSATNALEQMQDIGRNQADIAMMFASYSAGFGAGDVERCRDSALSARRLNPSAPRHYVNQEIRSAYLIGDYAVSAKLADSELTDGRLRPAASSAIVGACSHLRLGNENRACEMFQKVDGHPFAKDVDAYAEYLPIRRPEAMERWREDFAFLKRRA